MGKRSSKQMNRMFNKRLVKTSDPDTFWALPTELIGVEIEVEEFNVNFNTAAAALQGLWEYHNDGSLRNGIEWVLSGPLCGKSLRKAVDLFFDQRFKYTMSERTSVHLHVNMSDGVDIEQFRNIFVLMYLIEPSVFRWADENRKWCGYCSPLTDLSQRRLMTLLNDDSDNAFIRAVRGDANPDRYYGLNVSSYNKHGTIEFRYFPCTKDKATLISWIQFVMEVKKTAMMFDGPSDILENFNTRASIRTFMQKYFPMNSEILLQNLDAEDAVARATALAALIEIPVGEVPGTETHRPKSVSSKGFTKLIETTFAKAAATRKAKAEAKVPRMGDVEAYTGRVNSASQRTATIIPAVRLAQFADFLSAYNWADRTYGADQISPASVLSQWQAATGAVGTSVPAATRPRRRTSTGSL